MPKKGGKKGKGKGPAFLTDAEALGPYGVRVRDIIRTPLGVEAEVVGVSSKDGLLWLSWPGNVQSPIPSKAKSKADMEAFGYVRKAEAFHIQRSIDERVQAYFDQRWYGAPGPRTAAMRLPWPEGSPAFSALTSLTRPSTAPV